MCTLTVGARPGHLPTCLTGPMHKGQLPNRRGSCLSPRHMSGAAEDTGGWAMTCLSLECHSLSSALYPV